MGDGDEHDAGGVAPTRVMAVAFHTQKAFVWAAAVVPPVVSVLQFDAAGTPLELDRGSVTLA